MAIGLGVVAVTAILAKIFLFGNKKKKSPVTLEDPEKKFPLKLIDKEVHVLLNIVFLTYLKREVCVCSWREK